MQIVMNIPDEQIEKCLEESKNVNESEGEKGSVTITLLYTNKNLEYVDIERKKDFYSLKNRYIVLPEHHGKIVDIDAIHKDICDSINQMTMFVMSGIWQNCLTYL